MSIRFTSVVVFTTAILFTSLIGVCNGQLLRSNAATKTSLDRHSLVITDTNEIHLADDSDKAEVKIGALPYEDKDVDIQSGTTKVYIDNQCSKTLMVDVACSMDKGLTYEMSRTEVPKGRYLQVCLTNYPTLYYHGISDDGQCEVQDPMCNIKMNLKCMVRANVDTTESRLKIVVSGC